MSEVKVWAGLAPSEAAGGGSFLPVQRLGLQGFLGLWLRPSSLCLPLHLAFSSSVGQIAPFLLGLRWFLIKGSLPRMGPDLVGETTFLP